MHIATIILDHNDDTERHQAIANIMNQMCRDYDDSVTFSLSTFIMNVFADSCDYCEHDIPAVRDDPAVHFSYTN